MRRGEAAGVEGVDEQDRLAEPDLEPNDRAEEAQVLDDHPQRVRRLARATEPQRLGPQRQRPSVSRRRARDWPGRKHRRPLDADRASRRVGDDALKRVQRADERGDEAGARAIVDVERAADLLDRAFVHHHDPVGDRQSLLLVVGDEDRGDAEPALQRPDFFAQAQADARVERRQRLVKQQDSAPSVPGERTRCCWPPDN